MLGHKNTIVLTLVTGILVACSGGGGGSGSGGVEDPIDHPQLKVKSGPELTDIQKKEIRDLVASITNPNSQAIAINYALPSPDDSWEDQKKMRSRLDNSSAVVKKFYSVIANQDKSGRCQLQLPVEQTTGDFDSEMVGSTSTTSEKSSISGSNCPIDYSGNIITKSTLDKIDKPNETFWITYAINKTISSEMTESEFKNQFSITKSVSTVSQYFKLKKKIGDSGYTKTQLNNQFNTLSTGPNLKIKASAVGETVALRVESEDRLHIESVYNIDIQINNLGYVVSIVQDRTEFDGNRVVSSPKVYLNGQEIPSEDLVKYFPGVDSTDFQDL